MFFISKKSFFILTTAVLVAVLGVSVNWVRGATNTNASPDLSKEIKELNSTISQKKKQLDAIRNKQEEYQRAIAQKQNERASLQNQLVIVSNRLAQAQLTIDQIKVDIDTTNLEIQRTNLEISENDKSINSSKAQLASAIKLLSQEANRSQLEVLLTNNYITEYMNQVKYLEDINGKISESLISLKGAKAGLVDSKNKLEGNKQKLAVLRQQYEGEQTDLASQKDSKTFLIDETRSSEVEYQRLLAKAKREQDSANSDIVSLEKTIRQKMSQQNGSQPAVSFNGLIWPVPSHRVTALFHDPGYPFRYIFEHPAIDIATPQGTPIKAAASGYVGRAKDGGMGYSYIMIVHGDGLATVYGHVSRIYVKDNEYVTQGQVIGLSGATPGTPGAGPFTTGPHLHLEVRLNGIPVNPLEYLP